MTIKHLITATTAAAILVAGSGGAALAASGATTLSVSDAPVLKAGDRSPFDVAGVRAIRRGKAIPAGYALVGKTVTRDSGIGGSGAALRFQCPDGKRLRSFAQTGHGSSAVRDVDYPGHRATFIEAFPSQGAGTSVTIYAVCR